MRKFIVHLVTFCLLLSLFSGAAAASMEKQCTHMQDQQRVMQMMDHDMGADQDHDCCQQTAQCACPDTLCHSQVFLSYQLIIANSDYVFTPPMTVQHSPMRRSTSLFRPPINA
ncbi:hypothetical protein WCN91_05885 [Pseudoalteromonas sp. YIC-827]|uniref:DUF2946 domain-containing protein n=1 Tax=Pseudoalteromonas qingdaonensis TaxID=3131913 RepID=A0ABU9MYD1_9GAMM